jgi:hypothetical protein
MYARERPRFDPKTAGLFSFSPTRAPPLPALPNRGTGYTVPSRLLRTVPLLRGCRPDCTPPFPSASKHGSRSGSRPPWAGRLHFPKLTTPPRQSTFGSFAVCGLEEGAATADGRGGRDDFDRSVRKARFHYPIYRVIRAGDTREFREIFRFRQNPPDQKVKVVGSEGIEPPTNSV